MDLQKTPFLENTLLFFQDGLWLQKVEPFLFNLLIAIAIYWIGSLIVCYACKGLNRLMRIRKVQLELRDFLDAVVSISLKCMVAIIAINQLGINTTSLLALFGAAGLAVGLAVKDSLANFASGVMLILTKPFRTGNMVEAAGTRGIVEKITVFNTVLATPDNKEIIIPNAQIHKGTIINYSAKSTRRVDLLIGISYNDNIQQARNIIANIIQQDERILTDPSHVIAVGELAESSVNFIVRVWVNAEHYWPVKWHLLEAIKTTFDEKGVSIPFPQTDIHLYPSTLGVQEGGKRANAHELTTRK